nr:type VI secretion system accessory protein TagJ [uncultured Rhodopila sp.]
MNPSADPIGLFNAGRLDEAVALATETVRKAPADTAARLRLAEFLLFEDAFDRIDRLLDTIGAMDAATMPAVVEFRQVLRAEIARRQVFADGRVPEFVGGPDSAQRAALSALLALRDGDIAAAVAASIQAEAARQPAPGRMGDAPFPDWRDTDDLLGGSLEILTPAGQYYWVPFGRVAALQPAPVRRTRDLFWRPARLSVANGPEGDIFLPVTYPPSNETSPAHRLGRLTDWVEIAPGLVRGVGQKTFLIGDEGVAMQDLAPIIGGGPTA